jgi:hypothetical protein
VATFVLSISLITLARSSGPSGAASNGNFSPNQELPLRLVAPLVGGSPLGFIIRALEPSVRVDTAGNVYVASIRGVPGGVDLHRWSPAVDLPPNPDGTYPFRYKGQPDNPCGILPNGCANNTAIGLAEGGGDVDIAVNFPTSGTPNLALVSLTLAPGVTGTHSGDRGDSFSTPNPVVALIPGDDRQWIEGFGEKNVYLVYHDVATFNIEVQRSNDGGFSYVDGFGEAIDPQTFPAAGGVPASNTANTLGTIRVDRSPTCGSKGNLYQIFVAPDNVVENTTGGPSRSAYVGVSTDVKLGLPVFTFTDFKIATTPTSISQIFPALAVDAFGNLYATWSDNTGIFYTYSTNLGATWATPIQVNNGETANKPNVFPWIDADANGHVGIVWFGGDRAGNSNDATIHQPTPSMTGWTNWNVYYAESVNGHAAVPTFAQSKISDHVIHRGTVSTGGLGGAANRNLGDLFQIAFDPQHRANVAFSDDFKPNTVGTQNGADDPSSTRLIRANFTHQLLANPNIVTIGTTADCAGTTTPPPAETGRKITGGGRLGPDVSFGFVAKETPLNGALSYHDQAKDLDVKSSGGIDSILFSGNCATFKGNAKVNGQSGYRFSVNACDNAEPGAGRDTFGIGVTGPGNFVYSKGPAPITEGNIQMHK